MVTAKRLLTAEEFAKLPESRHAELIGGEVVEKMPTAHEHGQIVMRLGRAIGNWMGDDASAYLGTETGVLVERGPDRVRGPDVIYVSAEKMAVRPNPEGSWLEVEPELVAEVISPNETADEVRAKLRDYLSIGTQLVLMVYSSTREVEVHTPDGTAKSYREGDPLEFPEVLPGFRLEVAELFRQ